MLRIENTCKVNIWNFICCPLCGSTVFVSVDNCVVYCDKCDLEFKTRSTAGDPGVVIDVYWKDVWAPKYICSCGRKVGSFVEPTCECGNVMKRENGILKALPTPRWAEDNKRVYYGIFKLGDYVKCWDKTIGRKYSIEKNLSYSDEKKEVGNFNKTQEEWDLFQNINPDLLS